MQTTLKLSLILVLCLPFTLAATPYNPSLGIHPLQQLTTDETGITSVDADSDGKLDRAELSSNLTRDAWVGTGIGTDNTILQIKGATTVWSAIDFYGGPLTPYWGMGRSKVFNDYRDNDFYIDRSGVRRALTIDESTLNVGIDTDNPQQKLQVNGNALVNQLWISSGAGDLKIDNAGSANTLAFHTSGAERMRINNLGNVGIGTSSPGAKLHVVDGGFRHGWPGEINIDADGVIGGRLKILDNGNVGIGTANPGTNKLEVVGGPIKATGGLIIESRASDPASPVSGQMWLIV